jgi:hypothetical protein
MVTSLHNAAGLNDNIRTMVSTIHYLGYLSNLIGGISEASNLSEIRDVYAHLHAFQTFLDKEMSIYEQLHIQQSSPHNKSELHKVNLIFLLI